MSRYICFQPQFSPFKGFMGDKHATGSQMGKFLKIWTIMTSYMTSNSQKSMKILKISIEDL